MSVRERRAPSPATVVLASAALALVGNLATNTVQVAWAGWPMLVWGVAILLLAMVARIEIRRTRAGGAKLADELTGTVQARYNYLVVQYGVNQPMPLQVRWSSTGRPVAAGREVVLDDASGARWETLPLEGDVRTIVTAFLALPHRQLMVLGEAGAGKSVLATLLAAGLLKSVKDHGMLPVLLPLWSWDPTEPVADFAARRIREDYLASADRASVGRLLDDGRLLPILDGLDELPAASLGTAVRALDNFAATGCPLVVTCRGLPYEQAVKGSGTLLSRAAVVEIEPVGGQDVVEFLSHPEPARERWEPVFQEIREHGDGPLARALSTPLMVGLARTVYRAPEQNPGELVRVPDRDGIERLLLDQFVPAAYAEPEGLSGGRRRRYRPEQAARWLSCLALQMFHSGTRTLRWWELSAGHFRLRGMPAFLPLIVVVVVLAVLVTGVIAGSAPLVVISVLPLVCVLPGGLGGLLGGPLLGWRLDAGWVGVVGGVVMWAAMGTLPTWWDSVGLRRVALTSVLRTYHLRALMAFVQRGLLALLAFAVPAWFMRPDRLVTMATAGAVLFAVAGAWQGGIASWLWFRVNHLVLAARGWLPLRLIAFLDDARECGLLRHVAAELQFRHIILQDHLAARAEIDLLRRSQVTDRLVLRLAEEGRTQEVLALLPALDGIPVDRTARTALAVTLATTGYVRQAVEVLDSFHGRPSPAVFRLGVLLARLRYDEPAIELLDPGEEGGWSSLPLAEVLARHGRYDEAVEALRRGDLARPNVLDRTAARYGELLVLAGRREEAISYLRGRADTRGETFGTRLVLYQLLAEDGAEPLHEAGERGDVAAIEVLADRARAERAAQAAAPYLEALVVEFGRLDLLEPLVGVLQELDQLDKAITIVESVNTGHEHCVLLADLLIDAGRAEGAERLLREHDHRLDLADVIAWLGRLDEALSLLAKMEDDEARKLRAALLAGHGRIDDLRERSFRDTFAAQRLAELLEQAGRIQEARQVLNPQLDEHKIPLAGLLTRHGEIDEAIALLRPLLTHPALAVRAAGPLAELHAARGETDRAVAVLRRGIIAGEHDTLDLEKQLSALLGMGATA